MRKITLLLLFFTISASSQVGIGTSEPSAAAMLEVSSTSNDVDYKGFMPPRVTMEQRDKINATAEDVGLMVFVNELAQATQCLQIWNGSAWQDVYCINAIGFSNIVQNFDLGSSWNYSSSVPFFESSTGFFGITDSNNFDDITTLTNNFLGINNLNNGENGTNDFAIITFDPVDISSLPNGATVSFDYDFFEFDNGDDVYYTLVIDGIDQEEVLLIDGSSDLSITGTVTEVIASGTSTVALRVRIKQNGDDYAGFDNFTISPN